VLMRQDTAMPTVALEEGCRSSRRSESITPTSLEHRTTDRPSRFPTTRNCTSRGTRLHSQNRPIEEEVPDEAFDEAIQTAPNASGRRLFRRRSGS